MSSEWPAEERANDRESGGHRIYNVPTGDFRRNAYPYFKLEEAHAKATKLLSEVEIKPKKFVGTRGYSEQSINDDTKEVQRLEKIFVQSLSKEQLLSKKYSDILEAIVCEYGELIDWFGPKSKVIKTSRYDDYTKKIDLVVETEAADQEFSHLALGMDVTFSGDLQKKFAAIRSNLDQGKLGEVKYFLSDRPHQQTFAGPLNNVPQVVVGIEIERVKELGLLWMNRRNKELQRHPVQTAILEEAALQLKTFAEYAKGSTKKETNDLAPILERELQKIRELLMEKQRAGIKTIGGDRVFEEIKTNLALFTTSAIT